ncbi:MAG: class I SAM-dependent methyltransferase [Solirubrobacteraceae bacterium]|nr:class I SAM-dependent methyltransferase [Solirubrobacteraceae bacterium]
MRELRAAVWDQVPADALPERFEERRALLLSAVAAMNDSHRAVVTTDDTPASGESGIASPRLPLRVLDAGCGAGEFAAVLLAAGATVVAADAAQGALDRTAVTAPAAVRVLWPDGADLALPDDSVDLVWAGETLEHVGDGEAWLGELRRVLRPGGRLLLTTPDHPFLLRLRLALSRRAFDSHVAPWADHLRFFTAASLRELLDRAGFVSIEIRKAYGPRWARETLVATAEVVGSKHDA